MALVMLTVMGVVSHGVGHGGGHGAYASAMGPRESASRPPAAAEDTQG